ncbi:MAG: hypothetical protein ACEPOZ_21485 [Marinifilaceae bacterium]
MRKEKIINRRDFIKASTRGLILGSLTLMTGVLLFREERIGEERCDFDFVCGNCRKLKGCKLPEATDYKKKN